MALGQKAAENVVQGDIQIAVQAALKRDLNGGAFLGLHFFQHPVGVDGTPFAADLRFINLFTIIHRIARFVMKKQDLFEK